jgi:predicted rRNA methylase YqxC with S4 and FtsJ domains
VQGNDGAFNTAERTIFPANEVGSNDHAVVDIGAKMDGFAEILLSRDEAKSRVD